MCAWAGSPGGTSKAHPKSWSGGFFISGTHFDERVDVQSAMMSLPRAKAALAPRGGSENVAADGLTSAFGDSTAALAVLRRLARKQRPAGNYAATVFRDAGWPEVYFAFTDEADAKKFAEAVQVELIGSYSGWASQRAFRNRRRKAQGAGGARFRRQYSQNDRRRMEVRLLGRARRGSRAPIRRIRRVNREAWRRAILRPPAMWSRSAIPRESHYCLPRPTGQPRSGTSLY